MHRKVVPKIQSKTPRAGAVFVLITAALSCVALAFIVSATNDQISASPINYSLMAINIVLWLSGLCAAVTFALILFFALTSEHLPENPTWLDRAKFALWEFL